MEQKDKSGELMLNCSGSCLTIEIAVLKNKMLTEAFETIHSLEYNSDETNLDVWKSLAEHYLPEIEKLRVDYVENRELNEKTAQRNKLNREIAILKKATDRKSVV